MDLRNYVNSSELYDSGKKKKYFLILLSIKFCVESEQKFPYLPDPMNTSRKFNWTDFYANHENADLYSLQSKI